MHQLKFYFFDKRFPSGVSIFVPDSSNTDDHLRNQGFINTGNGYMLSPVYLSGNFIIIELISALLLVSTAASAGDECLQWMLDGGALPGSKGCESSCVIIGVDMRTFTCPNQCEKLCRVYLPDYITNNLTWAGNLTDSDKGLIKKFPLDALKVYQSKKTAEESTKRLFKDNFRNDESDAFRHFVWSGLLTKKLGGERAQLFLNSHESSPNLPPEEVDMDKFNNRRGTSMAEELIKNKKFSRENLKKEALKALGEEKLKVIHKRGKLPKWKGD